MAPSFCSSSPGVGVSAYSAGILLCLAGTDRLCLGRPYDQRSSGVGTIVAVPGGMVCCLEGLCE